RALPQAALEPVAQGPNPRALGRKIRCGDRSGGAEARDPSHVLRASAGTAFLASAGDERIESETGITPDEHADPLGSADLMPGEGHQIGPERIDIAGNPPGGLDRVDVQEAARLMHQAGGF